MRDLTCRVCEGRLSYSGHGAPPEMHIACRNLSNDMARIARSLSIAWDGSSPENRKRIRRYMTGELFRMINETTSSVMVRPARATATARLRRFLEALSRTKAGRAAIESAGIPFEG